MSMESDIEKSLEKGLKRGIVKAVEELICDGVVEDITQRAINVIGVNTLKAIDFGLALEKFFKILAINEVENLQNIIVEILKNKNYSIDEKTLREKLSNIKDLKQLKNLAAEAFQSQSEEAFINSLDKNQKQT